ncbi:iron-sulfur-binding ferredoxin reductase [Stutzerimonas marianensis]|uniref:Iron-sulfur-binding ferredoxin reductase n=1 Tax=Stutzerimonas marianensis TaxID=2929513 RepID=A0A9X2AUV3_9GAMM|nr:iron-sulfur-binding ferredoxin reductase [Pseudomonas marianensis]MCJ0973972.1 iron-sulfur-binding ferredoxin reductase [Pseudomonas marianensis]
MPEITCNDRHWTVPAGRNLLDELNAAGFAVPFSCRAGSCQACLVRCIEGEPLDARPEALPATRRAQGWRLACQCRIVSDLHVATYDPAREAIPADVHAVEWLAGQVLRLQLIPQRPIRYRAGQHVLLWNAAGVARPYSLASLPGEDVGLELHIDCSRPGAFADSARALRPGDQLRLGALHEGGLYYEPDWQSRPLLMLAAGTGLAPLWGLLREALRQGHEAPIRLIHVASGESYLRAALERLAARHGTLEVELVQGQASMEACLRSLRLRSRQEVALVCGREAFVEASSRRLFLAGLPRGQLLSDTFVSRHTDD